MGDSAPTPNGTIIEEPGTTVNVEVALPNGGIPTKEDSDPQSSQTGHDEVKRKPEAEIPKVTDLSASSDLYNKLLERLEILEKKLQKYISEEEEKTSEKEDVKETEEGEKEEEEVKEEEKEEEPFSVENKIKYLSSETWYLKEYRPIWSTDTSTHTLVISMKSSAFSTLHLPFEPDVLIMSPREESMATTEIDTNMTNRVPDRAAIACPTLLTEIGRITGAKLETGANILVRPFKILISFYEEFVQCLREQEDFCEKLMAEQHAKEKALSELVVEDSEGGKKTGTESVKDTPEEKLSAEKQEKLKTARTIANGMKCLIHFIDKDLRDIMEVRHQIKNGMIKDIAFEHLWHLFKPGDLVVSTKPKDQAYRVLHVGGGRPFRDETDIDGKLIFRRGQKVTSDFFLDCFNIDFNGTHYGPATKTIKISQYDGVRPIAALDVIPISFVPDRAAKDIEDALVTRGKKFVRLARVSHKKYKGLSVREGNFRHEELDSDVIIDFALAFKNSKPPYEIEPPAFSGGIMDEATKADIKETREVVQGCGTFGHCEQCHVYDDSEFDLARRSVFVNATNLGMVPADEGKLGKERQVLLPYRVYAYVLLSRKWYPLDIDLVEDVKETQRDAPDGFRDLVLPEDHKEIVRALVKTHARGPRSTSNNKTENGLPDREIDLVKGKGKGLIILLHGVPGVGKTSTAECVAANTNRPLFPITCGDIGGTTAKEVEDNLESYFDLARKWGCVLLLDEADVFLGERTKGDIVQNSLVSVFLRVLEYYSGILILTTNRVGQFDEAIKSRIHISLYYPPLSRKSTLEIWKMNLDRLDRENNKPPPNRPIIFSRKEIMNFAKGHWADNEVSKTRWNGRQIKNAFQTAIALAEWDFLDSQNNAKLKTVASAPLLEARHFRKVAEASARFDQYLNSVRKSDMYNAQDKRNRKDDFVDTGIPTETGLRYQGLEETKKSQRAKRGLTPQPESEEDEQSVGDSSEFSTEDTDDEYEAKKRQIEALRMKKEEQQRKKDEDARNAKKRQRELRKQQQREQEELKKREELQRNGNLDDSDTSE